MVCDRMVMVDLGIVVAWCVNHQRIVEVASGKDCLMQRDEIR